MRKIINRPDDFVDEMLDGLLSAHPSLRAASADRRALVRADAGRPGKVGIVTGGGSGHLPVFLGYVGVGLCDGVAVGNVFSSPSPDQILAATRAADGGAGVLLLYGNYGGDIYNFDLAGDLAAAEGIRTTTVLAADDVASAPLDARANRRGVAGMVFAFKIAGAAAERGDDLDAVTAIAQRVADATRTMGVGLSPTILPAAGKPTFQLNDGEMEVGIGIHGEPGVHRGPLEQADRIADRLVGDVLDDLGAAPGSRIAVLVNGLGATPLEELYLLFRRASALIADRELDLAPPLIGNYVTSLEMAGASISVLLLDEELEELLDAPAASPFFRHGTGQLASGSAAFSAARASAPESEPSGDPAAPPTALASLLLQVLERMPVHADELRELDAALGDGDLGITVASGARAAADAIRADPSAADAVQLRRAGAAFAAANPSTFAALIGGAVVGASGSVGDSVDPRALLSTVAARIATRGGAARGDKTVLDALFASADALDAGGGLNAAITAVETAISASTAWTSRRGRAAWLQERSVGKQDPGMTAYLAFLQELRAAQLSE